MTSNCLTFRAGEGALKSVRTHGFDMASIGTIAGASGGAKWLVLSQLDKAILSNLLPNLRGPVHLIGTSIGSWRFACYAQAEPLAAIDRFEEAYVNQTYSPRPDRHEISQKTREILSHVLGDNGVKEILTSPVFRSHIMAVRSRRVTASENRLLLGAGLLGAAALNALSRRTLGLFFERALFFDSRDKPPFYAAQGFPLKQVPLAQDNLAEAVLATSAIPLVLSGVRNIGGASPGVYRDGGIIDYHHDLPHSDGERLTLYPHFYDHLIPGWFDKRAGRRRPQVAHTERTILISPSAEFVARLPNAKIPDRQDFLNLTPNERLAAWRACLAACRELADEFHEVIEKQRLPDMLTPLDNAR